MYENVTYGPSPVHDNIEATGKEAPHFVSRLQSGCHSVDLHIGE